MTAFRSLFGVIIGLLIVLAAGWADPPEKSAVELRPTVIAVLKDGRELTGLLERFDDGEYWLIVDGQRQTFRAADVRNITFRAASAPEHPDPELDELIRRFLRVREDGRAEDNADVTLRTPLAKQGKKIVKPLLAAYAKYQGDYQQTGLALKELGSDAFPLLIEEFRQDRHGNYGHPVWYALRESGVQHAGYIETLLEDRDPRVRRLAMDTLYSWAITSGVALPTSLAPSLVKVLDDPDANVSDQTPLVLKAIGFRSELVLPALMKTLTDDRYGSVRGNAVLALGSLGMELKADDPDLSTIVTALATVLAEDPSDNVRSYAAMYLGYIGPKAAAAIPVLQRATDDKKEYVRKCAEEALKKVQSMKPLDRDPFGPG